MDLTHIASIASVGIIVGVSVKWLYSKYQKYYGPNKEKKYQLRIVSSSVIDKKLLDYYTQFLEYEFNWNCDSKVVFPPLSSFIESWPTKHYVHYSIGNEIFSICIVGQLKLSTSSCYKEASILDVLNEAYLIGNNQDGKIELNITRVLKEFQGPSYDYYSNIEGVSYKLADILPGVDLKVYNKLIIGTLMNTKSFMVGPNFDVRDTLGDLV